MKFSCLSKKLRNFVLFPYGFMTYGCAKWAVETVLTFSIKFTKLLGVTDTFALPGRDFRLPRKAGVSRTVSVPAAPAKQPKPTTGG